MLETGSYPVTRVLVVEDDYFAANDLKDVLASLGAEVVGPVPDVEEAMTLLQAKEQISAAILDINLGEEMVFPVADRLERLSIPYVFATAYDPDVIPDRYRDRLLLRKPLDERVVSTALREAASRKHANAEDLVRNQLLAELDHKDQQRLLPLLRKVILPRGAILERPGELLSHIYFPIANVASVIVRAENGVAIETGIIGREGMTGYGLFADDEIAPFEIINQIEGTALALTKDDFHTVYATSPTIRRLTARYARALHIQISFTVLANSRYTIAQRLARWLAMIADRIGPSYAITHEYLALMLGTRRASVTEALRVLEGEGLIRSTRGHIDVLDHPRLVETAEGCYGVPETEYRRLICSCSSTTREN